MCVLRLVSTMLAEISAHHLQLKESTTVLSDYYFSDKSFFCLFNYHNDSSTIPVAFIVKFWSTSIEMISSDTMKEESLTKI